MKRYVRTHPWRFAFLVLLVLVLLWLTAEKVAVRSQLGEGPRQTLITVSAESVRKFEADAVKVGDLVYKKGEQGLLFGKITDVQVKPARVAAVNTQTGVTSIVEAPQHYDVFVTIEATTERSPFGSTLIRNGKIELNQYLPLYTSRASLKTRVIGIEDKREGDG